jgi:hypothetical protein
MYTRREQYWPRSSAKSRSYPDKYMRIYLAKGSVDFFGNTPLQIECAGGGDCTIRPRIDFVKELAA